MGCWPNGCPSTPAAGCVVNARRLASPGTSVNAPTLVTLLTRPTTVEVPVLVRLPEASGAPANGRTRTLVQVSEQVTPELLAVFTVKTIWFVLRDVIATEFPLTTPLILALF